LALAPTTRVIGSSDYPIEVLFRFDLLVGYRKIIDFREGAADAGLYLLDGCLTFFPKEQDALTRIGSDSYVQIVLTRDAADRLVGYVDGVRQFAFNDSGGLAVVGGSNAFGSSSTTPGRPESIRAVGYCRSGCSIRRSPRTRSRYSRAPSLRSRIPHSRALRWSNEAQRPGETSFREEPIR
jgi:hypothetical protein